jgi:hypothetical protein
MHANCEIAFEPFNQFLELGRRVITAKIRPSLDQLDRCKISRQSEVLQRQSRDVAARLPSIQLRLVELLSPFALPLRPIGHATALIAGSGITVVSRPAYSRK